MFSGSLTASGSRKPLVKMNTGNFTTTGSEWPAALNISTFISLYEYGYRNVFELGPVVNTDTSRIEFVKTQPSAI